MILLSQQIRQEIDEIIKMINSNSEKIAQILYLPELLEKLV